MQIRLTMVHVIAQLGTQVGSLFLDTQFQQTTRVNCPVKIPV